MATLDESAALHTGHQSLVTATSVKIPLPPPVPDAARLTGLCGWWLSCCPSDGSGVRGCSWLPAAAEEGRVMRHRLVVVVAVSVVLGAVGVAAGARDAPSRTGRYIVVLKDFVDSPAAVAHAQPKAQHAQIGFVYGAAIKGYSATLSSAAVDALRSDPRVAAVVADRPVHLEAQRLPTGINRVDGERSSTVSGNGTGSVSVDIAIIDTGIDTNHPDLNVVGGVACNGSGYKPSRSGCFTGDPLHDAICRSVAAGVTYAVAAGNSSINVRRVVPAAYDEVITVSALADFNGKPGGGAAATCRSDIDDTFANFSNYGSGIDLIAPGVCIYSTYMGDGYKTLSGTSMASQHVAGAAALYKASHPGASPSQVRSALRGAANLNWNDADDPDGIKEPLLNVDAF